MWHVDGSGIEPYDVRIGEGALNHLPDVLGEGPVHAGTVYMHNAFVCHLNHLPRCGFGGHAVGADHDVAHGAVGLGKEMAQMMGLPFRDADIQIERRIGMSIPQYFAQQGEPAFRDVEREVILETQFAGQGEAHHGLDHNSRRWHRGAVGTLVDRLGRLIP